jgi:glycosyltransferase involved in cell wall biosynthesis
MDTQTLPRTLFLGRGKSAVTWYRCALPAMVLGQDWIGAYGEPEALHVATGLTREPFRPGHAERYDVIVLQLAAGAEWLRAVRRWQQAGITVLYEVDDWLRGIRKLANHDFKEAFGKQQVEAHELVMAACDGVICSTEWLAQRYRAVNPVTYVCRNGIDRKRYALTKPQRDQVAVGWAGGTGHRDSALPWVREVGAVMREAAATRFISLGQPFADLLTDEFGPGRALSIPFSPFDTYPAVMTLFDVALAPAGDGAFFRGKSDLRWLEASALGTPLIADPVVYPEIEHGVTGFHASTPAEMGAILRELVADAGLRERVGAAARAHVEQHRTAEVAAQRWAEVLRIARAARELAA